MSKTKKDPAAEEQTTPESAETATESGGAAPEAATEETARPKTRKKASHKPKAAEHPQDGDNVDPAEKAEAEKVAESEKTERHEADAALEDLQKKYDTLQEQHVRMAAEYDNFRKRSQREREQVHAEAVAYAVQALLPTLDNLERALAQPTEDTEYKKGVELTYKQLMDAFAKLNVLPVDDEIGSPFDPNLHNAVMHVEDADLGENVIAEVFQHGFKIDDKVIRHSMVKVAN